MDTIRSISEKVATYISSGQLINSPTVQRLFEGYCRGVEELNSRMLQCEVLAKDSSSVTVALTALRAPSIYSTMSCLDCESMREFLELCRSYQLIPNVEPNYQCYSTLENALSTFRTREAMTAQLRRLSREGSSEDKVNILRELVLLEPENSEWKSQLKQAEHLFLPQVINRGKQAIIDNNLSELSVIEEILCAPGWIEEVPSMVVDKIRKTLDDDEQKRLKPSATALIGDLLAACQVENIGRYSFWKAQWELLVNVEQYTPSAEENQLLAKCEEHFADVMQQCDLNHEFGDLLRQLYACVDDPTIADYSQCKYIYDRLSAYGLPIPEDVLQLVENRRIEENNAIMVRKVKRVWGRYYLLLIGAVITLICGGVVWHSFFQENFKREITAARVKEDLDSIKLWIKKIDEAIIPYRKLSMKLENLAGECERFVKEYEGFQEVADKMKRALNETPDYRRASELAKLLSDCKSKINCASAKETYRDLNKRYHTIYVVGLESLKKQQLKKMVGEVQENYATYLKWLGSNKFDEANVVYVQVMEQIRKIREMDVFSEKELPKEAQECFDSVSWLREKQRQLQVNILACLEQKDFKSAEARLELHRDNEKELAEKKIDVASWEGFKKNADLETMVKGAVHERAARVLISKLEDLQVSVIEQVDRLQFEGLDGEISKYTQMHKELDKYGNVGEELTVLIAKLMAPEALYEYAKQTQHYAGVIQKVRDRMAQTKNLLAAVEGTLEEVAKVESQKNATSLIYGQLMSLEKIAKYQRLGTIPPLEVEKVQIALLRDWRRYFYVAKKYDEFYRVAKEELKQLLEKHTANAQFFICFEDTQGDSHVLRGNIYELRSALKHSGVSAYSSFISFKVNNKQIMIEGNKVQIQDLADRSAPPENYTNVRFVVPEKVTSESLYNAYDTRSAAAIELAKYCEIMPDSIFDPAYYLIIAKVFSNDMGIDRTLELLLVMLKPFHSFYQLRKTDENSVEYFKDNDPFEEHCLHFVSDAYAKMHYSYEKYVNEKKVERLPENKDEDYWRSTADPGYMKLSQYYQVKAVRQELRKRLIDCPYHLLGVAWFRGKNNVEFIGTGEEHHSAGEVWGIDKDGRAFIAGSTDGSKIQWNNRTINSNYICAVFVPTAIGSSAAEAEKYRKKMKDAGAAVVAWPEFFPQELQR